MISAIRIFAVVALAAAASAEPQDTLTNAGLQGAPLRRIRSAMGRTNPDRARRQDGGSGGGDGDPYYSNTYNFDDIIFADLTAEQTTALATAVTDALCVELPDLCDFIRSVIIQPSSQVGRRNRRQTTGTEAVVQFQSSVTTAPGTPALTVENIAVGTGVVASASAPAATQTIVTGTPTTSPTPAPISDRLTTANPNTGGKGKGSKGGEGGKGTKGMGGEGGKGGSGSGSSEGGKGMGEGGNYLALTSSSGAVKAASVAGIAAGIALVAGLSLVAARGRNRKMGHDGFVDETSELLPSPTLAVVA